VIASSLQIRPRWLARHRWRRGHVRPALELIIRRALQWRWWQGRRHWRWRLDARPRRQAPLDPRWAHNGWSRLRPLLIARPKHALPLPPQSIGREDRTSRIQTDAKNNAIHCFTLCRAYTLSQLAPTLGMGTGYHASSRNPALWDPGAEQDVNEVGHSFVRAPAHAVLEQAPAHGRRESCVVRQRREPASSDTADDCSGK
jgi:hypothetical protein